MKRGLARHWKRGWKASSVERHWWPTHLVLATTAGNESSRNAPSCVKRCKTFSQSIWTTWVPLGQPSAALLYFMSLSTLVGWQEGHPACKNLCQLGPNVCPVKEPSFACLQRFSWHVRRTADRPTIGWILEKGHWSDWASVLHNYNRLLSL